MKIYIVMVDLDGMMRSTCDTPVASFATKELAEQYIKNNTNGSVICGGYEAKVVECKYNE